MKSMMDIWKDVREAKIDAFSWGLAVGCVILALYFIGFRGTAARALNFFLPGEKETLALYLTIAASLVTGLFIYSEILNATPVIIKKIANKTIDLFLVSMGTITSIFIVCCVLLWLDNPS